MIENLMTATWVDKSAWGEGPWTDEPDRAEWRDEATGLPCLALRAWGFGSWCGYVAVPPGHPWHGADYNDVPADAPGRLTFGGPCSSTDGRHHYDQICHVPRDGDPDDVWWLGFDCGHPEKDVMPGVPAEIAALTSDIWTPTYKTLAWVQDRVTELAHQAGAAA